MNLTIIIPNLNGKKLLEKNLPKVLYAAKDAEIIIVDDASTDESVGFLKKNFPGIALIEEKKNKGFSSSVNTGARRASNEFIFLLNSDCYPEKGAIEKIMPLFKDENLFAAGFAQKSKESGKTVIRGRGLGKFEKGFFSHSYGEPNKTNTQWVSGGAGIFRKSVWEKLGGMDEIYNPFYWEDIDLSYRAIKAGYSIRFVPEAFVVHEQSIGAIRSHYSDSDVQSISYRNQILFVWLNISDPPLLQSHYFYLPYQIFKSLLTFNLPFLKAHLMSKLKFFSAIRKRQERKKLWKKKDADCFVQI